MSIYSWPTGSINQVQFFYMVIFDYRLLDWLGLTPWQQQHIWSLWFVALSCGLKSLGGHSSMEERWPPLYYNNKKSEYKCISQPHICHQPLNFGINKHHAATKVACFYCTFWSHQSFKLFKLQSFFKIMLMCESCYDRFYLILAPFFFLT